MTRDRNSRLKSGVIAGLLASSVLVAVIWSFGYMTGYRMGPPLLPIIAVVVGVISGAQAYAVEPEKTKDDSDATLATFQAKAEERSRRR